MDDINTLYNQVQLKHNKLSKNRFALAPMTNVQSNPDGTLGEAEIDWLTRRAQGGFGIIITAASHVLQSGQSWGNQLGIFADDHIPGLTQLATSLKKYDSLNIIQLFHGGVRSPSSLTGVQPLSASSFKLDLPNFEIPREANHEDIAMIVNAFANATKRAVAAGFDGVEIHGANGYLFTQFISAQTNLRNDEYGNNLENRARLLLDVLRACREVVPNDFIIGVRLSPENNYGQSGLDIYENVQIAKWLEMNGVDYIHLSMLEGGKKSEQDPSQSVVELFRNALNKNTILMVAGGVNNSEKARQLVNMGVDIVALGTIAIANPDFPLKSNKQNYQPLFPPYSKDYLNSVMVSNAFIDYLQPRVGFIENK